MIWLAIPIGGVLVYLMLGGGSKALAYLTPTPGPAVPQGQPSPQRADTYLKRVTDAMNGFRASKIIPGGTGVAGPILLSTFDVVSGMAEADGLAGRISSGDLQKIRDRIASFKKEAGA